MHCLGGIKSNVQEIIEEMKLQRESPQTTSASTLQTTGQYDSDNYTAKSSMDSPDINKVGSRIYIVMLSIIVGLGGLIFGFDIGTLGGMLDLPSFKMTYGDDLSSITPRFLGTTKGILVGTSSIGGCLGGLITMHIVPPLGPRSTIFLGAISYICGDLVVLFAQVWIQVVVGRILNGCAFGIFCVSCPMLISDLAPINIRGRLVSLFQMMVTMGITIGAPV
ncbi:unnamed protein product [Ambrosiozyma monospora]|uniref:Unnamed protein product n=1 Tax=Ambrosiozyma monospora TaxID=43982 RepID=A0A9W6Z587_AMBMO|nr:unnamed protein product [Ambrosiozyma monospora]